MSSLVTALVLASAVAHATWNAMLKGKRGEPLAATLGLAMTWALLGAGLVFLFPVPAMASMPHLTASVLIHVAYLALLVAAYQRGDLSLVYPIARGLPPLIVAGAAWVFVGEALGLVAVIGVFAVVLGVLLLGFAGARGGGARSRASVLFALGAALCIAAYTANDGVGARVSGAPLSYSVWLFAGEGIAFSIYALVAGGPKVFRTAAARWREALFAGVISAGGYTVALWAMAQAPIALVAALRETSVLFAALIGTFVLGEPLGRRRVVAAALVVAGVVCLRLG